MSAQPAGARPNEARIAPWLVVPNGAAAVAFYRDAFGATERYRLPGAGGAVAVAQLAIGGADSWVQAEAAAGPATPGGAARLIVTVADPDALFARAVAAGATAVFPVAEAHGWRLGRLADPFGHHWEVGRPLASAGVGEEGVAEGSR
jgi:PhnB protein